MHSQFDTRTRTYTYALRICPCSDSHIRNLCLHIPKHTSKAIKHLLVTTRTRTHTHINTQTHTHQRERERWLTNCPHFITSLTQPPSTPTHSYPQTDIKTLKTKPDPRYINNQLPLSEPPLTLASINIPQQSLNYNIQYPKASSPIHLPDTFMLTRQFCIINSESGPLS